MGADSWSRAMIRVVVRDGVWILAGSNFLPVVTSFILMVLAIMLKGRKSSEFKLLARGWW